MNTCPNCGKVVGLHASILQGCVCQYSMQAPPQRTWQGLTDEEVERYWDWEDFQTGAGCLTILKMVRDIEAKLKGKNS